MKKVLLIASIFASASLFAQNTQCISKTKAGDRCLLTVNSNDLCWRHDSTYVKKVKVLSTICTGTTKAGSSCKSRTKSSTGLCHQHKAKN